MISGHVSERIFSHSSEELTMIAQALRSSLTEQEKTAGVGHLLELWLEIGPACHLRCGFCFNSAGGRGTAVPNLLSVDEYRRILQEFAVLGGKSVGIPGFGEPFHHANLEAALAIIVEAGRLHLRVNVYTSGDLLTEDNIWFLRDRPVCVSVKVNSNDCDVQDGLVGSVGYTFRRQRVIEILRRLGFSKVDSSGRSRLAFVTSILPGVNETCLPLIYGWCRDNGVVPDIDTLLPLGRAKAMTEAEIAVTQRVFWRLRDFDQGFGIEWTGDSPTYAGGCCDRYNYHLYVGMTGDIGPCLGALKKGVVVGNVRTGGLEVAWNSPTMKRIRGRQYSGRCVACVKFKKGLCHSCLGRFASKILTKKVETTGCWNFAE